MANIASSSSSIKKLNNNNYDRWSIRIKSYLLGQDLWSVDGGAETTPPTDKEEKKRWKIRAKKTMYVLSVTVEDEFLWSSCIGHIVHKKE